MRSAPALLPRGGVLARPAERAGVRGVLRDLTTRPLPERAARHGVDVRCGCGRDAAGLLRPGRCAVG
ncbi:hypothetical protein [Streptomyces sp. NPDC093970]|uniref:hypothetical protein n=1 Tax=Streptomyces sp. NPDC093970 TaxID=3155076 RepID=UPI00342E8985